MDESTLRQPRIVLLARDFPMQVTAMAVWLNEMDLDVTLMRFQAYRTADQVMLTVSQLLPVPDVEEFTVAPQRAEARKAHDPARIAQRQATATRRLADAEAVHEDTAFTLRPRGEIPWLFRDRLAAWIAQDLRRGSAHWRNDPIKPLIWDVARRIHSVGWLATRVGSGIWDLAHVS